MKAKQSQIGVDFLIKWVVVSAGGMFVGLFTGFLLISFISSLLSSIIHVELGERLTFLVFGMIIGIGIGILQWLVLKRRVSRTGWWVLTNIAACCGIFLIGFEGWSESFESFSTIMSWIWIVTVGGAVTGILQWLVLRRRVSRAGWWVLLSTVGWVLSVTVTRALPWGVRSRDALWGMTAIGSVMGLVTGGAIVWLLQQSAPET